MAERRLDAREALVDRIEASHDVRSRLWTRAVAQLLQQASILRFERQSIADAVEDDFELPERERLGEVVVSAKAHGLYGTVERRVSGDENHVHRGIHVPCGLQHGKPVTIGQLEIRDYKSEPRGIPLELGDGLT